MGNRTKRPPGRPKPQSGRPSAFFLIALALGVILLVWMVSLSVMNPRQPSATTTASSTRT